MFSIISEFYLGLNRIRNVSVETIEPISPAIQLETSRKVKALVRLACVTVGVSAAVLGRRVIELRERCALSFCLSCGPL